MGIRHGNGTSGNKMALACVLLLACRAAWTAENGFPERLARARDAEKAEILNEWAFSLRTSEFSLSGEKAAEARYWAKQTGDKEQQGWALALIGLSKSYLGQQAEAETALLAALDLLQGGRYQWRKLFALNWLGIVHYQKGEYDKALELYARVRDQAEGKEAADLKAGVLSNIAIIQNRRGEFQMAMKNYLNALDICEAYGIQSRICGILLNIGVIYSRLGNSSKAMEYYRLVLDRAREFASQNDEASALANIGVVFSNRGQDQGAEQYYLQALAIRKRMNQPAKIAHLLVSLAISARKTGRTGQAQDYLDEAQELLASNGLDYLKSTLLLEKGSLLLAKKEYLQAIAVVQEALAELKKTEVVNQEIEAYLLLSEIYSELGDNSRALAYYRSYRKTAEKYIGAQAGNGVLEMDFNKRKEKLDLRFLDMQKEKRRVQWAGGIVALGLAVALTLVLMGKSSLKRRSLHLLSLKESEITQVKGSMQWMMGELKDYLALKGRRRYEKSHLKDEEADRIVAALKNRMEKEQEYVNPDLTLSALADMIGCSAKELSQVINERFGKNFNDFINGYRVEFAKTKLASKKELSILEIAFEAGFNSKTSFNISFKKLTGMTPREFRQQPASGR